MELIELIVCHDHRRRSYVVAIEEGNILNVCTMEDLRKNARGVCALNGLGNNLCCW